MATSTLAIELPPEMAALIQQAVDTGQYSSSDEAVYDALLQWSELRHEAIPRLKALWEEAVADKTPGVPMEGVMDRLEAKYTAMAGNAEPPR